MASWRGLGWAGFVSVLVIGTLCGPATGQTRAKLPTRTLAPGRNLPIQRQITLPGLNGVPAVPPAAPSVPPGDPVVGPRSDAGIVGIGTGAGLQVDGTYSDDRWRLGFHLGTGSVRWYDPWERCWRWGWPGWRHENGWVLYRGTWYPYASHRYYYGPVDGSLTWTNVASLSSAQTPAAPPQPEPTPIEKARARMVRDDAGGAVEAYRAHLREDPEDVGAMRELAIALVEADQTLEGAAMMGLAYHTDATLARTPIDLAGLGIDGDRLGSVLSRMMGLARRTGSSSAWLAASVALQGDRRVAGAARVLERAREAGLEAGGGEELARALGVPAGGGLR